MKILLYTRKVALVFIVFMIALFAIFTDLHVFAASPNSTIASIEINSKNKVEIERILNDRIDQWRTTPLIIETDYAKTEIDTNLIEFNVKEAVAEFVDRSKRPWYGFWKKPGEFNVTIPVVVNEQVYDELKKDPSIRVEETVEIMKNEIGQNLSSIIVADQVEQAIIENDRIAFAVQEFSGDLTNLEYFVQQLNDFSVLPNEKVSFLEKLDSGAINDPEAMDFMASVIYTLLLQSNYSVLERHPNSVEILSFTPGTEAHVNVIQSQDLVFVNPNAVVGTFKFKIDNGQLVGELYSIPLDVKVEYHQTVLQEVEPRTIIRYSDKLTTGSEEMLEVGKSGLKVATYRKIIGREGSFEKDELMSTDFYPPVHHVILKSSSFQSDLQPGDSMEEGDMEPSDLTDQAPSGDRQETLNDDQKDSDDTNANPNANKNTDSDTSTNDNGNSDSAAVDQNTESKEIIYDKSGLPIKPK